MEAMRGDVIQFISTTLAATQNRCPTNEAKIEDIAERITDPAIVKMMEDSKAEYGRNKAEYDKWLAEANKSFFEKVGEGIVSVVTAPVDIVKGVVTGVTNLF